MKWDEASRLYKNTYPSKLSQGRDLKGRFRVPFKISGQGQENYIKVFQTDFTKVVFVHESSIIN